MESAFDAERLLNKCGIYGRDVRICVALSGGRDSVALLHCLKGAGYDVSAVNVEHGIRGEESKRDSAFVRELCDSYGVPLHFFEVDAPAYAKSWGFTLEQAARELRYSAFDSLLEDGECDFIALAHHLDDQVETVLMRVLRGTGVRGLVGMKRVNGRYIRPFLDVARKDIDEYARQNGLKYVDDSTNDDAAYTRNFLRKEIATLKTRFPRLDEAVARLSNNAAEVDEYLNAVSPQPEKVGKEVFLPICELNKDRALAKKAIMKAAAMLGVEQDIERRHFPLIFALAAGENGKRLQLTHGLDVHKQGAYLAFAIRHSERMRDAVPFGEGEWENFGLKVEKIYASDLPSDLKGKSALYIDCDKVPKNTVIRTRETGDRIDKFGGGSKSLGDFLTDKKVPPRHRDTLAIVACGRDVLAVAGVDIASTCAIDDNTRAAYKLTVTKK